MKRTLGVLAVLFIVSPAFGQRDESPLADALAEIKLLKRVVAEQDRRLAELEKAIAALSTVGPKPPTSGKQPLPNSQLTPAGTGVVFDRHWPDGEGLPPAREAEGVQH